LDERLKAFDSILNAAAMINVCTGVEATPDVNVHEFERVGNVIIEKMIDQNVYQYSFLRTGIARTMASNSKVKLETSGPSIRPFSFNGSGSPRTLMICLSEKYWSMNYVRTHQHCSKART